MPELALTARPALDGYRRAWPDLEVEEVAGRALASVSTRRGAEGEIRDSVRRAYGVALPEPGRLARGDDVSWIWMGPEQWFAEADEAATPDLVGDLGAALGESASVTEQSDSWVLLSLSGPQARAVLARLCPLDLHPSAYPLDGAARTAMEHIGAMVLLLDEAPSFLLLSPRSSARSFLHAVETAARTVCG